MSTRVAQPRRSRSRVEAKNYPIIVSFYAGDVYYHKAAKQLENDCRRLGLDYDIREAPLKQPIAWIDACRYKIKFISQCLETYQRPILWLDVDCRLLARPEVLKGARVDIAFFLRAFRYLKNYDPLTISRTIDPSLVYYGYTERARQFVKLMKSLESKHRGAATDDYFLQEAWQQFPKPLSMILLPPDMRSLEMISSGREFFYFGRSGQVSVHKDRAQQHPIAIHSDYWRKRIFEHEANELIKTNNFVDASALIKKTIAIDPHDLDTAIRLARLMRQMGKTQQAIRLLRRLQGKKPAIDYATRFRLETSIVSGQKQRAQSILKKLIEKGGPDAEWAESKKGSILAMLTSSPPSKSFKHLVREMDSKYLEQSLQKLYHGHVKRGKKL